MSQDSHDSIEHPAQTDLPAMISDIDDMVRQGLVEVLANLEQQRQSAQTTIEGLRAELARVAAMIAERVEDTAIEDQLPPLAMPVAAPVFVAQPILPAADVSDWEESLLGPELCGAAYLARERQTLLAGLAHGHRPAQALVGQLLAFRACDDERRAQLLKEVGEAYYAWRPETARTDDPFREALIGFLTALCQEVGVSNSVELVRPGDRFDSKRHNAKSRGIEIDEVYGWIVLRDNGSVYTKASVAAK